MLHQEFDAKINSLPAVITFHEPGVSYEIDLDKVVKISSLTYFTKQLSLRNYLKNLERMDSEKATAIYEMLLALANPKNSNLLPTKLQLVQQLGVQRRLISREKSVGQRIFEVACVTKPPRLEFNNDFLDPIHEFSASHTPSTKIHNDKLLCALRLFEDIPPSLYRRAIYVSSQLATSVTLNFPNDISEQNLQEAVSVRAQDAITREVPRHSIKGKLNEWIPLTTLTNQDTISDFAASFPYQLGYSKIAKQYYVKPLALPEKDGYKISYKLHEGIKKEISYDAGMILDEKEEVCLAALKKFQFGDPIQAMELKNPFDVLSVERKLKILQYFFQQFKDENLSQHFNLHSLEAINLMMKEQKGVCDHRAFLCREVAETLGLKSHDNINDIHALCELESFSVDLGGGTRTLLEFTPDGKIFIPKLKLQGIEHVPDFKLSSISHAIVAGVHEVALSAAQADFLNQRFIDASSAAKISYIAKSGVSVQNIPNTYRFDFSSHRVKLKEGVEVLDEKKKNTP